MHNTNSDFWRRLSHGCVAACLAKDPEFFQAILMRSRLRPILNRVISGFLPPECGPERPVFGKSITGYEDFFSLVGILRRVVYPETPYYVAKKAAGYLWLENRPIRHRFVYGTVTAIRNSGARTAIDRFFQYEPFWFIDWWN